MTYYKRFLDEVSRGRKGLNAGLPIGLPKLGELICNLQKKCYYLIGANTGVGKSTFMLEAMFATPLEHIMDKINSKTNIDNLDVEVLFYSFEMDVVSIIAKMISRRIYKEHRKVLTVPQILSRGNNLLSEADEELVISYSYYWQFFEDKVRFIDHATNPTQIYKDIKDMANRNGTVHKKKITTSLGEEIEAFHSYTPHNPNKYLLVYIDHLALAKEERSMKTAELMGKISEYIIEARNMYGITAVVVQQLNLDIYDPKRAEIGRLAPTLSDFGDNRRVPRDAEVVIALHSPMMFNQANYAGYDIKILKDRFRTVDILKNRYGSCNIIVPLIFNGAAGVFAELPEPLSAEMKEVYNRLKK